jgi:hypothetical protein
MDRGALLKPPATPVGPREQFVVVLRSSVYTRHCGIADGSAVRIFV